MSVSGSLHRVDGSCIGVELLHDLCDGPVVRDSNDRRESRVREHECRGFVRSHGEKELIDVDDNKRSALRRCC